MAPRYIVRFDDICPTMNWTVWDQVEAALIEHGVRPLLAVVPDNRDPDLAVAPARADFWERVRRWQAAGWTIGLHGHQHVFATKDAGIVGLNAFSEYAGLPQQRQREALQAALAIFDAERVKADVWIAPAHSFDETTLDLLREAGLSRISDGFFLFPGTDRLGNLWVPQQLWEFAWRPIGVWTVCHHINAWSAADVARFRRNLGRFRKWIVDFDSVSAAFATRRLGRADHMLSGLYRRYLHASAAFFRTLRPLRLARQR
jgi:predicted deacetylase